MRKTTNLALLVIILLHPTPSPARTTPTSKLRQRPQKSPGRPRHIPGQPNRGATKSPATSPNDALAKAQAKLNDWPQLKRYAADNAALPAPDPAQPRVVFYGDSITDVAGAASPTPETSSPRPTSTAASVARPPRKCSSAPAGRRPLPISAAVLILAGTNDIAAGNTGPSTPR